MKNLSFSKITILDTTDISLDYKSSIDFMSKISNKVKEGGKNDVFWILECDNVFTVGKMGKDEDILDKSIDIIETNRGGQVTYHGPGQTIMYIIIDIKRRYGKDFDINIFIRKIEEYIINFLQKLKIKAERRKGMIGVWVKKINGVDVDNDIFEKVDLKDIIHDLSKDGLLKGHNLKDLLTYYQDLNYNTFYYGDRDFKSNSNLDTLNKESKGGKKTNLSNADNSNQSYTWHKIAAIGVGVYKGVSIHGCALNVTTNLDMFNRIVPCGITDYGVSSLKSVIENRAVPNFDKSFNNNLNTFLDQIDINKMLINSFCKSFNIKQELNSSNIFKNIDSFKESYGLL